MKKSQVIAIFMLPFDPPNTIAALSKASDSIAAMLTSSFWGVSVTTFNISETVT